MTESVLKKNWAKIKNVDSLNETLLKSLRNEVDMVLSFVDFKFGLDNIFKIFWF